MPDLQTIQANLETRKADLQERLGKITSDSRRSYSSDWDEQAQERENDEVLDQLGNETRLQLLAVEKALERIRAGTYGSCDACDADIAPERLAAYPEAGLCVACASKQETRQP